MIEPALSMNVPAIAGVRQGSQLLHTATFMCRKCKLQLPLADMDVDKKDCCKKDTRSYKSLQERWSKDRKLYVWWRDAQEPEQTAWYRKQRNRPAGEKRDVEIMQSDVSKKRKYDMLDMVEKFEPVDIFVEKKLRLNNGWTEPTARAEFERIVDKNESECVWQNGQWHVPKYAGLVRRRGGGIEQEAATTRQRICSSAEDLRQATACSQAMLDQFGQHLTPARGGSSSAHQELHITSQPMDQPVGQKVQDVVGAALLREACDISLGPFTHDSKCPPPIHLFMGRCGFGLCRLWFMDPSGLRFSYGVGLSWPGVNRVLQGVTGLLPGFSRVWLPDFRSPPTFF